MTRSWPPAQAPPPTGGGPSVVRYYTEAGADYGAWSSRYNMHFGYWRRGLNPLRLEPMLEEMTLQVLSRLGVDLDSPGTRLLDLGCGLGAPARLAARHHPGLAVDGVTLVPAQARDAGRLVAEEGLSNQVRLIVADYTCAPLGGAAYRAAYAIESACHDRGLDKRGFVREAARLLAPGGRLVIADGFLKHARPMSRPLSWCYRRICANWALETFAELDRFTACLREHGFGRIRIEDASWRLAPSALHIPTVTARFLWRELRTERLRLGRVRWGHVVACVLSPLLGAARTRFGYYLITAEKGG